MFRKAYVSLLALVMTLTLVGFSVSPIAGTAAPSTAAGHDLLSSLPASDFILYVDAQRVVTDVIPNVLLRTPEERARFEADLNRFLKDTGLDPRLLDTLAIGMNLKSRQRGQHPDFALIARGRFDAQATIGTAFAFAAKESGGRITRQTEQYEGRTIYVLAPARQQQTSEKNPNAAQQETGGERSSGQAAVTGTSETSLAVVVLDANTIAGGTLGRVRATIDASMGRERVSDELVQLASRTPGAVLSFSGNVAPETIGSLRLGSKSAENHIASIRQIYGSFNTSGNEAEGFLNLRTEAAENARQLATTLNALKFVAGLGAVRAAEKKSVEAVIKNLNINAVGNEVQLSLKLTQAELAPMVRIIF